MFAAHYSMQISPRAWAAQILDGARAGDPVPVWHINRALQITGDLPKTFNPKGIPHEPEPLQAADTGASGAR